MRKSLIKIAAFLLLGAATSAAWAQSSIQGRVTRVENASLLHVQGVRLSLEGIVTPQDDSPLGREARGALRGLTWEARLICVLGEGSAAEVRPARCYFWDQTKPEAIRAELGEADKQPDHEAWLLYGDLAVRLVQLGLARDCPALTGGRYASLETKSALQRIALPEACSP